MSTQIGTFAAHALCGILSGEAYDHIPDHAVAESWSLAAKMMEKQAEYEAAANMSSETGVLEGLEEAKSSVLRIIKESKRPLTFSAIARDLPTNTDSRLIHRSLKDLISDKQIEDTGAGIYARYRAMP